MLSQIIMTVKGVILLAGGVYGFAALLRREDAQWVRGAPLKLLVGLFLIGMWGHTVWVPWLAVMLAIPLLSKSRADAAALYLVAIASLPVLYNKVAVGGLYLFPFTKYLFAALGLIIAYFVKPGSRIALQSRFDIPILLVLLLELAAARDPNITEMMRQAMPVLLNTAVPYFLVTRVLTGPEDLRRFVLALGLVGFTMAIIATVESRTHWLLYKQMEGYLHIQSTVNAFAQIRGGVMRAPTSFAESTSFGNFLALAAVAIVALRSSFATKWKWQIALAVLLVGLVAPNSRGAYLGVAIGLILFDLYRNRWGPLFTKLAAGAVLYVVLLGLSSFSQFAAEMVGKGAASKGSTDYRVQLFQRGLEEIHKHPLFGQTMKAALAGLEDMRQGEHIIDLVNGYITYGLSLGYTGMLCLMMVFATLCGAMLSVRRKLAASPMMLDFAAFVFAVSGFMMPVSAFTTFGGEGSTYFFMACAIGSVLWAMRLSPQLHHGSVAGASRVAAPSAIRAMIEADRAAALARRRPGDGAPHPGEAVAATRETAGAK